jgi:hypothetical protein
MYERTYGGVKMTGHWNMVLTGSDGKVKQEVSGKNVVVTNGLEFLASFLNSAATAASTFLMRYIAIGTDATAEAVSNTALGTELSRHTGTVTYTSGALYEVVATFAAGSGTGAIAEYGLFSANSGGTMFSRDTESVINKGASDTLTVTTKVTVG